MNYYLQIDSKYYSNNNRLNVWKSLHWRLFHLKKKKKSIKFMLISILGSAEEPASKPMPSFNAQIITKTNKLLLFAQNFRLCLYELFSKSSYWTFVYKDLYIKYNNLTISHLEIWWISMAIQHNFHKAIRQLHFN